MAKTGFRSVSISDECNQLVEALVGKLSIPGGKPLSKSAVIEVSVKSYTKKLEGGEATEEG